MKKSLHGLKMDMIMIYTPKPTASLNTLTICPLHAAGTFPPFTRSDFIFKMTLCFTMAIWIDSERHGFPNRRGRANYGLCIRSYF